MIALTTNESRRDHTKKTILGVTDIFGQGEYTEEHKKHDEIYEIDLVASDGYRQERRLPVWPL